MRHLETMGRAFFGFGIAGIGVLHFFFPGIKPIIIPGLSDASPMMNILGYLTGVVLVAIAVLISTGWKHTKLSLVMGIIFLILALAIHLPAFLNSGRAFWVNLNKMIALSGGFLLMSNSRVAVIGKYLFAIMLFLFGIGHLMSSEALAGLVPEYIPFRQFWAFMGGIALTGGAISIVTNIWTEKVMLVLAAVLFIWLISLHMYYAVLYPNWEQGENFIGVFTCLCFCGTALMIAKQKQSGT